LGFNDLNIFSTFIKSKLHENDNPCRLNMLGIHLLKDVQDSHKLLIRLGSVTK